MLWVYVGCFGTLVVFVDGKNVPVKIMTGMGEMKKITIVLILLFGIYACSSRGGGAVSGATFSYDLPQVVHEKHEAVIYPAGR